MGFRDLLLRRSQVWNLIGVINGYRVNIGSVQTLNEPLLVDGGLMFTN